MYLAGNGVPQNFDIAFSYLRRGANLGSVQAQYELANCYSFGRGVAPDPKEANRWCRIAAEKGYAPAQAVVGRIYRKGAEGIEMNMTEALKWLQRAAIGGDASAQFEVGLYLFQGQHLEKDQPAAVKQLRAAALQGYAEAQNTLGWALATGQGIDRDPVEAYKWYLLAAAQKNATARANIEKLRPQLTAEQTVEAEGRARRFAAQPNGDWAPLAPALRISAESPTEDH